MPFAVPLLLIQNESARVACNGAHRPNFFGMLRNEFGILRRCLAPNRQLSEDAQNAYCFPSKQKV